MKKWLFNPFEMIAGWTSLLIGIGIILITGVICFFGKLHLDGAIDLHGGTDTNLTISFSEGIINWLIVTIMMYITGRIVSKSTIRFIDVAGTQAMARFPYLAASLATFIFPAEKILEYIEWKIYKRGDVVELSNMDIILIGVQAMLTIACAVWLIVLMYKAYSVSCNLKGSKGIFSFIAALLAAEIVSKILLNILYKQLN